MKEKDDRYLLNVWLRYKQKSNIQVHTGKPLMNLCMDLRLRGPVLRKRLLRAEKY